MSSTLLFQVIAAILTILIAVVPLWYPRYSCYRREAEKGLEELDSIDIDAVMQESDGSSINRSETLSPGDTGFRQVSRAIETNTGVVRKPVKILLTLEGTLGTTNIASLGPTSGLQARIIVEYEDGTQEVVVGSPSVELQRVTRLSTLKSWVNNEANRRSHYWTTILAVAWGTSSLFIIF